MWKGPCVKPCKAYEVRTSNSVSPTIASESQKNPAGKRAWKHLGKWLPPWWTAFFSSLLNKRTQGFDMVATENPDCRIPSTAESPAGGGGVDSQELIVDSPDLSERNNDLILGETPWCFPAEPYTSKWSIVFSSKLTTENNRHRICWFKIGEAILNKSVLGYFRKLPFHNPFPSPYQYLIFPMPPPIESSFCLMMFHMIAWTMMVQLLQVMDLRNELFRRGNLGKRHIAGD